MPRVRCEPCKGSGYVGGRTDAPSCPQCGALGFVFTQEGETVAKLAPVAETAPARTESREHPGLFVENDRQRQALTFTYNGAWEVYSARTGELVDCSDRGTLPAHIQAYVKAKVQELLPPHRREQEKPAPAKEETAPAKDAVSLEAREKSSVAPIVGAPAARVKKETTAPMLDYSNPQAVAQARAVAGNIIKAHNIPELEGRKKALRDQNVDVETAFRRAEVEKEQAARRLAEIKDALKEREAELILLAAEERGEDGKKRYTADGAKAAAVSARKSDEEYLAIKGEQDKAAHALAEAEIKLADAKARQRAMAREFEMAIADSQLAAARINALGGLDQIEPATQTAA